MTDVVMAGGGFAGLGGALFLARRGHHVTVLERDPAPPTGAAGPDDDFGAWRRPGAPHARQSHALLGRARRVLMEEAPDVLDALLARGVLEQDAAFGVGRLEGEAVLLTRRLVAEAVLRRIVENEPGVTIVSGEAVVGLDATTCAGVPVVTGVRTDAGRSLPAQLVVDAGGRRSAVSTWLADLGARPLQEESQECGFFYLTRFYRVRPGCERPVFLVPGALTLDYATVLSFGADNGWFSLSLALSVKDPHRQALRDPERFDRFFASVPSTAPALAVGEPMTDTAMMARIENRRRRLVDDQGPVVGGIVPLGDASLHTNPTLGRGISLALWQAQHLAQIADEAPHDPVGFVGRMDDWTQSELGVWFDTQCAIDANGVARLEAGIQGRRLVSDDAMERFVAAAFALGATDEVVGAAVASMAHLLVSPLEALGNPEVASRVAAFLATEPDLERPPDLPSRAQFEAIAVT